MAIQFIWDDGGRGTKARAGQSLLRRGDCVTRALAICLDIAYDDIYDDVAAILESEGYKQSPDMGVQGYIVREIVRQEGWLINDVGYVDDSSLSIADLAGTKGRIIVVTTSHIVCIKDGKLRDTYDSRFKPSMSSNPRAKAKKVYRKIDWWAVPGVKVPTLL